MFHTTDPGIPIISVTDVGKDIPGDISVIIVNTITVTATIGRISTSTSTTMVRDGENNQTTTGGINSSGFFVF
jgi:hypothetical protein